MYSVPNGSPPPYESEPDYVIPQPAYSYYADDELQHFYRWSSPPGIIKIMAIISIVLCVGIFACVASTLAWDTAGSVTGMSGSYDSYGGYGGYGSAGSSFGGGFGGGSYGYGILGSQNDPRKAKGFIIAMAILTFAIVLTMFIILISHHNFAHTRKFYLILIIVSAILAFFMLVATLVYLVGVNPMAQTSGSVQYYQVQTLCAQYQVPQTNELFVNQYLYHYCVVDPQEAVAIVFGFLVLICLIIIMVFAIKTRLKINASGKDNILWRRVKAEDPDAPQDVEDWVNNVSNEPEPVMNEFPQKFGGSRNYLNDSLTYDQPPESLLGVEHDIPVQNSVPYYSSSEAASSVSKPKKRRAGRPRHADGKDYDTDYASSGDELDDDDDFSSEFPPIDHVEDRDRYKREFDHDHQEYKSVQAELDEINKRLAQVDHDLEELEEGTSQYLDAMDEYKSMKDKKRSGDYLKKKKRCKYLKAKLNYIKRLVNDFDTRN